MNDGPSETQLAKIYDSFQVSINEEIYVLASWFGRQCKIIQTKSQSKRIRSLSRDHIDRLKEKKKEGERVQTNIHPVDGVYRSRWVLCVGSNPRSQLSGGCWLQRSPRAV